MITLKTLWGSPGTELSTWSIGSFLLYLRAIQRTRIASRPLRSYRQLYSAIHYTAIQPYIDTIQLYIAIHYTTGSSVLYNLYNLCNS